MDVFSLVNLVNNRLNLNFSEITDKLIPFSILQVDYFSVTFILSLFNRGVCLPFNKENELNLKNPKIKQQKYKFESEQKRIIFSRKNGRKNNHDLYRSLDYIPRQLKKLY